MSRFIQVTFSRLHSLLFRVSGGRIGRRFRGSPVLMLTTVGRKSGKRRTNPLLYLRDGESWIVVASNGGRDTDPSWLHNLRANPRARIRIGGETTNVTGKVADAEEHARLWPMMVEMSDEYSNYQAGTERPIPLVILQPA